MATNKNLWSNGLDTGNFTPMKIILTGIVGALLLVTGCVTGSHIITGNVRPAIAPEAVKIYTIAPNKFDDIGVVTATTGGNRQSATDRAVDELKKQAAKLGANGILLSGGPTKASTPAYIYNPYGGMIVSQDTTSISGEAIYVP